MQDDRPLSKSGGPEPPDGRSPSAPSPTPQPDLRLATFAELLAAVDRSDTPAALAASRTLRKLGLSVVITGKPARGGRS